MAGVETLKILDASSDYSFKGAVAENFAIQEMTSNNLDPLAYFS
jgi:hypothetical protein